MHFYRRTQVNFFCDGRRGVRKDTRPFPSWSTFATIVSHSRFQLHSVEAEGDLICVGF